MKYLVTEKAMRPASDERQCFYCQQAVGLFHKPDCVLISKVVTISMHVEYPIVVPADWKAENVEFHRNEGSWCSDNAIGELERFSEAHGCLCQTHIAFKYIRDENEPFLNESGNHDPNQKPSAESDKGEV